MGTREQLLTLFENNRGTFFSGESIASRLSISRAAVWKTVKALQEAGYPIQAVRNKGYCLLPEADILSAQGIQKYLGPACRALTLDVLQTVDSTNAHARAKASAGAPEGYVVFGDEQTSGRGRRGRSFYSPPGSGLYMSLILRPRSCPSEQAVKLTTIAAVAACRAIEEVSDKTAQIKWVNDIYVNGRKVCGILTEAAFGLEDGCLEYAVLGAGFNLYPPAKGFPPELQEIAGTIFTAPQSDAKNRLAAAFLNRFMQLYASPQPIGYEAEYRSRSLVIGREVQVVLAAGARKAQAVAIDDSCRLVVRYEDGAVEHLSSGDVRIRL